MGTACDAGKRKREQCKKSDAVCCLENGITAFNFALNNGCGGGAENSGGSEKNPGSFEAAYKGSVNKPVPAETEHYSNIFGGMRKGIGTENNHAYDYKEKCVYPTGKTENSFAGAFGHSGELFESEENKIHNSPDYECPVGAVPDSGEEPDDEEVKNKSAF